MNKHFLGIISIIILVGLAGCTTTQKATTVGTIAGAGIGGIIGHQSGHDIEGAAIGGVIGALGGYIVGDKMEEKEVEAQAQEEDTEAVE